jgi:hypothetical protein
MANYHLRKFPKSRIATFDVFGVGREKHHIYVMLECDVTNARQRLKELKAAGGKISFTGWLRRMVWRYMLRNPRLAYAKMGNVSFTSIGMMGQIPGWFIHSAVHPLSFGIGSIVKKPVVKDDAVAVREILHMTILVDHDVIDGAPMARMVGELVGRIECGR